MNENAPDAALAAELQHANEAVENAQRIINSTLATAQRIIDEWETTQLITQPGETVRQLFEERAKVAKELREILKGEATKD